MRFVGGPYSGRFFPCTEEEIKALPTPIDFPCRQRIEDREYMVDHLYDLEEKDGEKVLVYRFSQFEWANG